MLVDTHCHLFKEYYENIEEEINTSLENNVELLICASTSLKDINEVISLANTYPNVYACIGIHPEECNDSIEEFKYILENNKDNKKIVAIGEIGLDYYYGKETREKQLEIFDLQLSLAEEHSLPVVIHSREATLDTLEMIKKHKVKGVMHSYTGSLEIAHEYMKLGFYFGVNGILTFKNTKIGEVIKDIPLNRLLLETDSPYLTPEPFRGKVNSSKYIPFIAKRIADIKKVDIEEVSRITLENTYNIFDLK